MHKQMQIYLSIKITIDLTYSDFGLTYTFSIFATRRFRFMSKNKKNLTIYKVDAETFMPLPYADGGIKAGFPSPAQDYISQAIDLNKELMHHPSTTFYGREWKLKQEQLSQRYTTDINEILTINCK